MWFCCKTFNKENKVTFPIIVKFVKVYSIVDALLWKLVVTMEIVRHSTYDREKNSAIFFFWNLYLF